MSDQMDVVSPALPPEIWEMILRDTPMATKRACLAVSRTLHDIAVEGLFAVVHIHFGPWEYDLIWVDVARRGAATRASDERWSARTWDILDYIARKPAFGALVKHLVVHAFSKTPALFERNHLVEALKHMSKLRSFSWDRSFPDVSPEIVEALAVFCPRLEEVCVPIPVMTQPHLHRLTKLQSIMFPRDFTDNTAGFMTTGQNETEVLEFLQANARSLVKLRIWGGFLWASPMSIQSNLTHLELMFVTGLDNLPLFFRHSRRLESLTIQLSQVNPFRGAEALFTSLAHHPAALPHLTSLKLLDIRIDDAPQRPAILGRFLSNRIKLRRLDIVMFNHNVDFYPLFQAVASLKSLKVLGIHHDGKEDWMKIYVPQSLTALSFVSNKQGRFLSSEEWIRILKCYRNLAFLYLGLRSQPQPLLGDLVDCLRSIRLIGFRREFYDVCRGQGEPASVWPDRKVALRSADDFESEDWEWLMRHHDLSRYAW